MPPSRLSSLLVRDGVVSVKRMEHAFQRQVIYGGCLDTILLEMNVVPEERLVQYLSLATGLPPATRSETEAFDLGAAERCPVEVARMFRVVPLSFEEGALRVLVHDPVDLGLLEELANELDVPVQPLVVPEYRFHVVFTHMYGGLLDARYSTLAKRAEDNPPISPVGKARTVIVDDMTGANAATAGQASQAPAAAGQASQAPAAAGQASQAPAAAGQASQAAPAAGQIPARGGRGRPTLEMASGALVRRIEAQLASHTTQDEDAVSGHQVDDAPGTSQGAAPGPDQSAGTSTAPTAQEPPADPAQMTSQDITLLPDAAGAAGPAVATPAGGQAVSLATPLPRPATASDLARQDTTPLPDAAGAAPGPLTPQAPPVASTPLEPGQAIDALARAEERDTIFNLLLRAIRYRARYAGLLTVQGDAAIGRVAILEDRVDHEQVTQVLVPLDEPSPFRAVARSAAPHLGPISTADPEIGVMLQRMGVVGPVSVLLLPVVLRDRVVAIGVGHNGAKPVDVGALPELLPVARQAADAISRLIVKTKSAGRRRADGPGAGTRQAAEPASPATTDQMPAPLDSVLSAVESDDPALTAQATAEALQRTAEVLEALRTRFPGKLLVERYELEGRVIAAAQHGPILALIMRMGVAAAGLLVEKMGDPSRDVRYYATLCASELRPRSAIDALVERLFDSDYGIRSTAIAALGGYPTGALDQALTKVREALYSDRSERVQAAANALAKLADVRAVPDLIEVIAQDERNAEQGRLALVRLTKQDFGTNARKWRSWWNKSQSQSRVEWLIEGLSHKDENIRRSAVEELRQLTGEYFGFHHDLPKREREQARQRWVQWWKQTGRHRFLRGEGGEGGD